MAEDPGRQKWFVLATTALGAFMGAVMFTSVNVAMPSLVKALETEFNIVQWVVLAYLLATGTLLPIIGRLADMIGKKVLYTLGYVVFTLGSLLCALAPNVLMLILFRAVQGLGAASLTALSIAIITDIFPAKERGKAIGINGSILSTGIVIGPTMGGLLVDALSWRWIFILAVPLGILGTLLAQRFIPSYAREENQAFDWGGAALLFFSLLLLLLALTFGQDWGFDDPVIVGMFVTSAVLTALFIWLELKVKDPIIELRLFRNARLSIGLITGFTTFITISGTIFLIPFYLENVLGFTPRNVGLLMSIVPIVLVIVAPIAGTLADRYGERPITVVGMVSMFIGYLLVGTLSTTTTALGYVLRFFFVGLGMGVFQTPNNSAIMGSVEQARSGVAGGLLALTRTVGQTAGIAVLGTFWAARTFSRSAGSLNGDATQAAPEVQVAALHDMFFLVQVLIGLGLALVVWDWIQRRRKQDASVRTMPAD